MLNRPVWLGLLAATAAWFVVRRNLAMRKVPAAEAANRLREAWANNHTIA
jgi:hypothetical protein